VLGKSRVNAMEFGPAIDAFEESLEANPHSAQAHFQLAMLYENQESDPAAAIYHYQQYLKYVRKQKRRKSSRSILPVANSSWPRMSCNCLARPPRSGNWKSWPRKTAGCTTN